MTLFLFSVAASLFFGQLTDLKEQIAEPVQQLLEKSFDSPYVITEIAIDCRIEEASGRTGMLTFSDEFPKEMMFLAHGCDPRIEEKVEELFFAHFAQVTVDSSEELEILRGYYQDDELGREKLLEYMAKQGRSAEEIETFLGELQERYPFILLEVYKQEKETARSRELVHYIRESILFTTQLVQLSRDHEAFVKEVVADILDRLSIELQSQEMELASEPCKLLTLRVTVDNGSETKSLECDLLPLIK